MTQTPLPVFLPGSLSFRLLLEQLPGDEPRQFRPIRAGGFLVSIQASEANASLPPGSPPPDDVDAFEVAIFAPGPDGEPPRTVSPLTHPHLFRDARWAGRWTLGASDSKAPPYWSGHFVPTGVIIDLLTCLCDPGGYTHVVADGINLQPV